MTDVRTQKQRMIAGDPYDPLDAELQADHAAAVAWMARYNALDLPIADRHALLREGLGQVGERAAIRPPFHCDYGYNVQIGEGAFLNFNCVILDVTTVTIGAGCQIGPHVQLYTADHPRDPAERASGVEFARPIHIGRNVWVGGGSIIVPGVTVGGRRDHRGRQRGHSRRARGGDGGGQSGAGAAVAIQVAPPRHRSSRPAPG